MTKIRALHQLRVDGDPEEVIQYVQKVRTEPGCLESEAHRSINDPADIAIVQVWEDQFAYGDFWGRVNSDPDEATNDLLIRETATRGNTPFTDFYSLQYFTPGPVWTPAGHESERQAIFWPGTGAVRIIIQVSPGGGDALLPMFREDQESALREPGVLEYQWYRSLEFENQSLLLELWEDAGIYNAHHVLRRKTSSQGSAPAMGPREHGSNGFEFYRAQPFVHQYNRWMPADVHHWADESIIYPN
ncbi:antibiotic biosynthesis monooxygenase [Gordonia sp. N1V]|uniref:putative quinol monooxygenase n=1 Tax=Gordonia sp. N1V TaxID=3034163 RepID=UPI0023E0ED4F|nr:antibiotic biosynthesis monooxygenase [Gordonia sp. N1V]MDF3282994.1 antibiotic biosynthesis monooxygenase [Gordonia sp. N1V]